MFGSRQSFDPPFTQVNEPDDLHRWFSTPGLVLLMLHDPWCPISRGAFNEVAQLPGPVPLIDVSASKSLSKEVALRTGIRHESPQAMLLRDGAVIWHASHWGITKNAIDQAIAEAEAGPA